MRAALPFLAVAALVAPASAAAASPEAALREALVARLGDSVADVAVADLDAPPDMPADAAFEVELPSYQIREGHLTVTLRTARGSWRLNPEVLLWVDVPVAATETARGEVVPMRIERVRLGQLRGALPVDPAERWEATSSLHAGQPVTAGRVRRMPDLRQGATVKLVVEAGALSVRAPGQLLADAVVGEPVPVLNLATRAQQFGTLRADGTVLLGGP